MPENDVIARAHKDASEGKAPSTQAGEFVREEIEHVREGVHGARSVKQAIAIGLSKARRAGVKLSKNPNRRKSRRGREARRRKSSESTRTRARSALKALRRESTRSVSRKALSRHARSVAKKRGPAKRSASAKKAARTRKKN
jgi:Family of unknown function (DUF6496)